MTPDVNESFLLSLSSNSSLMLFLRAFYSLGLEHGVYYAPGGEAFVFSKDQVVTLVERGFSDAALKDLPRLAEEGVFRPLPPEELESPDEEDALIVERRGAYISSLAKALNPAEVDYPEWWEAPIPFAIITRGGLKLNQTAVLMFGSDLERLNSGALPEKDEFIVELEGRTRPCFLAFRRLEPNIFTIDDCTGDLVEAQDISWWAAVGRAWTLDIEARGLTWRRSDEPSETGQSWPCEWQGRSLGYFCVEEMPVGNTPQPVEPEASAEPEPEPEPAPRLRRRSSRRGAADEKEDEVLQTLGPQAMGLLAPGLARPEPKPRKRSKKR